MKGTKSNLFIPMFVASLILLGCHGKKVVNTPWTGSCPLERFDWLNVTEGYSSETVIKLASSIEAAAKADAESIRLIEEGSGKASFSGTLRSVIQNSSGAKAEVSQVFYEQYIANRTALCAIIEAKQNGFYSDADALKEAQKIYTEIATSFSRIQAREKKKAIVWVMDSPLLVYSAESRRQGRMNADDIMEALDELDGVKFFKEPTSTDWQRGEFIRRENPDLIIIHISAFYDGTTPGDDDDRFKNFLRQMSGTKTRFLLYTRSGGLNAYERTRQTYIDELQERLPSDLAGRLFLFQFPKGKMQNFRDMTVRQNLRYHVRQLLELN